MMWTQFNDTHSITQLLEPPYVVIIVEAPSEVARRVFIRRFGHDPKASDRECCGPNYASFERETPDWSIGERMPMLVIPAAEVGTILGNSGEDT